MEYTPIEHWIGMALVGLMLLACPVFAFHGAKLAAFPARSSDRSNGLFELAIFAPVAFFMWYVFLPKMLVFLH